MNAEIAKLRYLPLPRWTAAAVLAVAVVTAGFLFGFRPKAAGTYSDAMTVALNTVFSVAPIIIGVWFAALEFASGTMQRTLTAEPRRNRVLLAKLTVALAFVAVLTAAACAAGGGLTHLAAVRGGVDLNQATLARSVFSIIPDAVLTAVVGFGFGLLARSIGGGVTLALGFVFVVDGALNFVPWLKNYTFGQLSQDLTYHLGNLGATQHSAIIGLLGSLVWLVIVVAPGWFIFLRADLK